MLQDKDCISRKTIENNITKLDDTLDNENKTFTGGCNFLLRWYQNNCSIIN